MSDCTPDVNPLANQRVPFDDWPVHVPWSQLRPKPPERVEPMWSRLSHTTKLEYAKTLGARPDESIDVRCAHCDLPGTLAWVTPHDHPTIRFRRVGTQVLLSPPLEFDHIHPLRWGGLHEATNLQILCNPCNLRKGAKR